MLHEFSSCANKLLIGASGVHLNTVAAVGKTSNSSPNSNFLTFHAHVDKHGQIKIRNSFVTWVSMHTEHLHFWQSVFVLCEC